MLRIRFSMQDIQRVRIIPSLGPFAEALHSLVVLRRALRSEAVFSRWRQQVLRTMDLHLHTMVRWAPTAGSPDLLDLTGPQRTVAESIAELQRVDRDAAPAELVRDLLDYHRVAIDPYWTPIRAVLTADYTDRVRTLIDTGVEGLFTTLHPDLRWAGESLELAGALDGDIDLLGRGLTLAPSFFRRRPHVLINAAGSVTLSHPAPIRAVATWDADASHADLASLLGRTRALLLVAIGDGPASTGQLALSVDTSAAAVSQHTKVLRGAGLITTIRQGQQVKHALTRRGEHLLGRRDDHVVPAARAPEPHRNVRCS